MIRDLAATACTIAGMWAGVGLVLAAAKANKRRSHTEPQSSFDKHAEEAIRMVREASTK